MSDLTATFTDRLTRTPDVDAVVASIARDLRVDAATVARTLSRSAREEGMALPERVGGIAKGERRAAPRGNVRTRGQHTSERNSTK